VGGSRRNFGVCSRSRFTANDQLSLNESDQTPTGLRSSPLPAFYSLKDSVIQMARRAVCPRSPWHFAVEGDCARHRLLECRCVLLGDLRQPSESVLVGDGDVGEDLTIKRDTGIAEAVNEPAI